MVTGLAGKCYTHMHTHKYKLFFALYAQRKRCDLVGPNPCLSQCHDVYTCQALGLWVQEFVLSTIFGVFILTLVQDVWPVDPNFWAKNYQL